MLIKSQATTGMSGRGRGGGRGAYYKEKYGGGRGRGRGSQPTYGDAPQGQQFHEQGDRAGLSGDHGGHFSGANFSNSAVSHAAAVSGSSADLEAILRRIHGGSYKAYHDIAGSWAFPGASPFTFFVDWVQGDPFASPSRCRVLLPPSTAMFPPSLHASTIRSTALCDFLTRSFGAAVKASGGDVRAQSGGWHGEKGGEMSVDSPGQHVLQRTSVLIQRDGSVEARFTVGLPARGRTVLGDWAATVLVRNLPRYVEAGLRYARLDPAAILRHVECVEDTNALRQMLPSLGLVAFVGDSSVLPRGSGASDKPMPAAEAVPFASPESLAVEVALPNRGRVRGMGVKRGVTLIVGGGYNGKSTLLEALENGVYDKIPGDGRELVATDPSAVKIRAEDGRRVAAVDISPFISNLPLGRDTRCFSSEDASGSTSQAANIQEALEVGASALLIDEDTSATNFMVRDARMAELVAPAKEPITPFVARIRSLATAGISTVLVVGGTGEYFAVADCVIALDCYRVEDVTARAHDISQRHGAGVSFGCAGQPYPVVRSRAVAGVVGKGGDRSGRDVRCKTRGVSSVEVGDTELDLSAVEQLVEVSQTRAIASALLAVQRRVGGAWRGLSLHEILDRCEAEMDTQGMDALLGPEKPGNLARPRRFEIAAALNRLRSADFVQLQG